jgi:hypothetical protein
VPLAGIYLLTAAGAALALWAPLEMGFGAVLGAWMLIPAGLILPGLFHVFLVNRIILGAFALRLLWRYGRHGEPAAAAYRPTALHAAWGVLLVAGYVDGALLSPASLHNNLTVWLTLADCCVFLVAALAVVRTIGPWRMLRPLAAVTGTAAGIGIVERLTGHGWASYLSEHVPAAYVSDFIFGLASRGGSVRAQGASEFALEYGWVMAIVLPLLAIAVSTWVGRNRGWGRARLLLVLVPVAELAAVVLSKSRSAEVAVAAAAVLLVALAGASRRLTLGTAAAAVAVVAVLAVAPSALLNPFHSASSNSIESRLVRLKVLFALTAHHPFVGLGYTGFGSVLVGLDDAYAETFGQLGVIGLLAWMAVLVTTLAIALRTLRAPRSSGLRQLGAACVVGTVGVMVASAAYDLTFTEQSMWTLVLLGVLAVSLAEHLPARARAPRSPARAMWPVAGAAAGAAVLALAPLGWSRTLSVYLISPRELATQSADQYSWIAGELASTACGYLAARPPVTGTELSCSQPTIFERSAWPAQVTVEVSGPSAGLVRQEVQRALGPFSRLGYPTVAADGPVESGRPAWATTAPLSGAAAGFMAALLVSPLRRRRPATAPQPAFVT